MENSHINESILSDEILEDQKKNRIDHMTYLPGMEDIGSDVMDQVISAMNAYDYEKYTRFDHPILMADYIMDNEERLGLEVEEIEFLCDVIKTHMGPWTKDYNGVEVLERPKTKYQNFVHMCDFLASRKCILVPFNDNDEISV